MNRWGAPRLRAHGHGGRGSIERHVAGGHDQSWTVSRQAREPRQTAHEDRRASADDVSDCGLGAEDDGIGERSPGIPGERRGAALRRSHSVICAYVRFAGRHGVATRRADPTEERVFPISSIRGRGKAVASRRSGVGLSGVEVGAQRCGALADLGKLLPIDPLEVPERHGHAVVPSQTLSVAR